MLEDIRWDYDREADVLYISIGPPTASAHEEVDECEGLHIGYAMDDNRVTGATVLYFSKQDRATLERLTPFPFDFGQVE